jgi:transposase
MNTWPGDVLHKITAAFGPGSTIAFAHQVLREAGVTVDGDTGKMSSLRSFDQLVPVIAARYAVPVARMRRILLEKLPDHRAEAMISQRRAGLLHREIADNLGVSTGTVSSYLREAGLGGCIKRPMSDRTKEMIAQRLAGATLAKIGVNFGVTTERVRQILKEAGVSKPAPELKPEKPLSLYAFHRHVLAWLRSAGYVWCPSCRQAKPREDFLPKSVQGVSCRACHTLRMKAYYHKNPEALRAAKLKWEREHPGAKRLYDRRRWEKLKADLKADPVKLAAFRAFQANSRRKWHEKLKADPVKLVEFRAKKAAYDRAHRGG